MPRARKPQIDDLQGGTYGSQAELMRQQQDTPQVAPFIGPDEVSNLSAPSARQGEPVTTGLDVGPGAGSEIMQPAAPDPVRRTLQSMLLFSPENTAVMRLLDMLDSMGR